MAPPVPIDGGSVSKSSTKPTDEVGVIDVVVLPSHPPPHSSSDQAAAHAVGTRDIIDVDDPLTWTVPVPSTEAGPSAPRRSYPQLMLDRELGKVLQEQKMEVKEEEEVATGAAATSSGVAISHEAPGAVATSAEVSAVEAFRRVPSSPSVGAPVGPLAPHELFFDEPVEPRPRLSARHGKTVHGPGASATLRVQRGRTCSKWDNPRHPLQASVRKAAVMSAAPRIIAGPPSPPSPSGSSWQ